MLWCCAKDSDMLSLAKFESDGFAFFLQSYKNKRCLYFLIPVVRKHIHPNTPIILHPNNPFKYIKLYFPLTVENLKVPLFVHFTWFYNGSEEADTSNAVEMKFYQLLSLLSTYKKIKPYKILVTFQYLYQNHFNVLIIVLNCFTLLSVWLQCYGVVHSFSQGYTCFIKSWVQLACSTQEIQGP